MKKLFLIFLAVTSLLLIGCETLTDPVSPNRRVNISGTVTTGPMRNMPTLASRGYHSVGLVTDLSDKSALVKVGLTMFQNEYIENAQFVFIHPETIRDFFVETLTSSSEMHVIDLSYLHDDVFSNLEVSSWDGKGTIATEFLSSTIDQNIDVLLLVDDYSPMDYIGHTSVRIGPKGVYQRFGQYHAFGGFRVRLIDSKTGKELKHSSYIQATSRLLGFIPGKDELFEFSPDEIEEIKNKAKEIYRMNVEESLRMLKVIEVNIDGENG